MKLTIVSGGQTGVDRAALAWARRATVPHGGWCPRDRRSEDGCIPYIYHLRETPSRMVDERTLWNVRDSDGTAIISQSEKLRSGTAQTARFCFELERPVIFLCAAIWPPREAGLALRHFVMRHRVHILNIAGPRASEDPFAGAFAREVLDVAFGHCYPGRKFLSTCETQQSHT